MTEVSGGCVVSSKKLYEEKLPESMLVLLMEADSKDLESLPMDPEVLNL